LRNVTTERVIRGDIEQTISALGKVQPRTYVDVGAQASGQLKRLLVEPGDSVTVGQLLAEIDPQVQDAKLASDRAERDRLVAALAEALAQADFAAGELERQNQLRRADATRTDIYDQSVRDARTASARVRAIRAQIAQAESAVRADQAQLGFTRIYAPISGTVTSVDARQGQTINATYSTPVLMRIAELSAMTVWTQVSEADVGQVVPGMPLWFTTLGHGERRWTSRLRQILPSPPRTLGSGEANGSSPPASPASNGNVVLYTALFDVANGDGLLRPEMSAQVFFVTGAVRKVPTVSMTALTSTGSPGRFTAQVVAGRSIETRAVRIGVHNRFKAQILSGLRVGERVVSGRTSNGDQPSLLGLKL
jgi:macrolide-specific efflux system membrane fusion protein